jgi:hypothetical protein
MLRIPHCLDNRLTDDGKVVTLTHRPSSITLLRAPRNITPFKRCYKFEYIQPHPWGTRAKYWPLAVRSLLSSAHQFNSMNPQNSSTKELFTFTLSFFFSRYSFCPFINALFFHLTIHIETTIWVSFQTDNLSVHVCECVCVCVCVCVGLPIRI